MLEQGAPQRRGRAKNTSQVGSLKAGSLTINKCVSLSLVPPTATDACPCRSATQLKLKDADYFDPGRGAELGVADILRPVEADATGPTSTTARVTSASLRARALTTLYPQDPLAMTSTDNPRPPALLVDDTPSSAQQSQHQPLAFGRAPHPAASQPDPILDDSQPLPFSFTTPDSIASLDSTHAQGHVLPSAKRYSMQKRLEDPPASYVPMSAGAAGQVKVKAAEGEQVEQVRRPLRLDVVDKQVSDPFAPQPASMDLDENDSTNLPPTRPPPPTEAGPLKRRSTNDSGADVDRADTTTGPRSKRPRCSEASEIEV